MEYKTFFNKHKMRLCIKDSCFISDWRFFDNGKSINSGLKHSLGAFLKSDVDYMDIQSVFIIGQLANPEKTNLKKKGEEYEQPKN